MERFGWSLREIDETDMESLLSFLMAYPRWKAEQQNREMRLGKNTFCDEVDWL